MKTLIIEIFKLIMRFIYFILKLQPTNNNKIVFISRQTDNINIDFMMLKNEIEERDKNIKMIFLCKRIKKGLFNSILYIFTIFRQMQALATSKVAILDSYSIPVCILKHKKSLFVLQIWHSIGKIKKSGYQTLDTPSGHSSKMAKLMCMHKNYDKILAGGPAFDKFYEEGFNVKRDKLLHYGLPRIDYLLQNKKNAREKMYTAFPELKNKKVVYYAPTFRTYDVDGPERLIEKYNPKDFAFILTCHPNQKLNIDESKIYKLSLKDFDAADILNICDYLITDYSSIALEAAVLKVKTLYYLYDYDEYMSNNGLNLDPKKSMPTCCFEKPEEILKIIKNDSYDVDALDNYIAQYLPKKLGESTKLIIDYVFKMMNKN